MRHQGFAVTVSTPFRVLPLLSILLLASCAGHVSFPDTSLASPGVALHGSVHGGVQPISGSAVYLFAAGVTGYNSSATSLLNVNDAGVSTDGSGNGYVTTGVDGSWAITGDYTCPSASSLVYMVAYGGNPGLAPGTDNTAISLLAALGPCGNLTAQTTVNINELTTVASVYALAQFANPTTGSIATSATNIQGLTNAFANVANIVNLAAGTAYTATAATGSSGIVPQSTINSLADILANCTNSNGTTSACTNLFADATPPGGTAPATISAAALNVALHPLNNASALYGLIGSQGPFQPTLTTSPYDWTIAIDYSYSSSQLNGDLGIDSQGNVWAPHYYGSVAKLSPLGVPATGSPFALPFDMYGYDGRGGAIDLTDSYWFAANTGSLSSDTFVKFNSAGTIVAQVPNAANNVQVQSFAIDPSNNLWAVFAQGTPTATGYLYEYNSAGTLSTGFPITNASLTDTDGSYPEVLAITPTSGNVVIPTNDGYYGTPSNFINGLVTYSSAGALISTAAGYPVNYNSGAHEFFTVFAIDASGNYWIGGIYQSSDLIKTSPTGTVLLSTASVAGSATRVVMDGNNDVWGVDQTGIITEFDTNGNVLSKGAINYYGAAHTDSSTANSLAIDSSGNLWAGQYGNLYQYLGLAPPVITPLASAVSQNKLATRP